MHTIQCSFTINRHEWKYFVCFTGYEEKSKISRYGKASQAWQELRVRIVWEHVISLTRDLTIACEPQCNFLFIPLSISHTKFRESKSISSRIVCVCVCVCVCVSVCVFLKRVLIFFIVLLIMNRIKKITTNNKAILLEHLCSQILISVFPRWHRPLLFFLTLFKTHQWAKPLHWVTFSLTPTNTSTAVYFKSTPILNIL